MKNKCYRTKLLKEEIKKNKAMRRYVLRDQSLTKEKREGFISLGHCVEISLWQIQTKHFYNIRSLKNPLLKEIHYAYKRGKKTIATRKLSSEQQEILRQNHISFRPLKYNIYLK